MEAVETLVALMLFLSGLYIITPSFELSGSAVAEISQSNAVPLLLGISQMLLAVPLLYALLNFGWPLRQKVRRAVTFAAFILLLFHGYAQVIFFGVTKITWTMTFTLALIMGVAHLHLKWEIDD